MSVVFVLAAAAAVQAATVVVPSANAALPGQDKQHGIFGNGSDTFFTFQELIGASQLGEIPVGAQITGIAYRLAQSQAAITGDTSFPQFDVRIGRLATSVAAPSTTFAANEGPDAVLARTGPLIVPANSFVAGSPTSPFVSIAFTTPYTYTGGDLALTIRDTLSAGYFIGVDANLRNSTINTVGSINNTAAATTGTANFFNAPIVQFTYVPEPASLAIFGLTTAAALGRRRRGVR